MAKPVENPNRVVTFLSNRQMSILKKLSDRSYGAPISALVRQAVEDFCNKQDEFLKRGKKK
jgi:hypothetical protein